MHTVPVIKFMPLRRLDFDQSAFLGYAVFNVSSVPHIPFMHTVPVIKFMPLRRPDFDQSAFPGYAV